jgi:DNA-binding transcriptional regulator YiaG
VNDQVARLQAEPLQPGLEQPLADSGFRFDPRARCWRRIVKFHKKMPPRISRAAIARELGIPEEAIANWEQRAHGAANDADRSAADLIAPQADGRVNTDPFCSWGLRFYPSSGAWRRTRADRNEVDREVVARKVGLPVASIIAWEDSLRRQIQLEENAGPA